MKRSVVPAQITTVEDKVIGNLSPYQVALMVLPLLFGIVLFTVFPRHFHFSAYKIIIMATLEVIGAVLSIRVHDMMLVQWLIIRLRYNVRPRFFVFDKNSDYLRDHSYTQEKPADEGAEDTTAAPKTRITKLPHVALSEVVRLEELMASPHAKMRFQAGKKGRLNVVIHEVKQ
jgi:hypothetical protein